MDSRVLGGTAIPLCYGIISVKTLGFIKCDQGAVLAYRWYGSTKLKTLSLVDDEKQHL